MGILDFWKASLRHSSPRQLWELTKIILHTWKSILVSAWPLLIGVPVVVFFAASGIFLVKQSVSFPIYFDPPLMFMQAMGLFVFAVVVWLDLCIAQQLIRKKPFSYKIEMHIIWVSFVCIGAFSIINWLIHQHESYRHIYWFQDYMLGLTWVFCKLVPFFVVDVQDVAKKKSVVEHAWLITWQFFIMILRDLPRISCVIGLWVVGGVLGGLLIIPVSYLILFIMVHAIELVSLIMVNRVMGPMSLAIFSAYMGEIMPNKMIVFSMIPLAHTLVTAMAYGFYSTAGHTKMGRPE